MPKIEKIGILVVFLILIITLISVAILSFSKVTTVEQKLVELETYENLDVVMEKTQQNLVTCRSGVPEGYTFKTLETQKVDNGISVFCNYVKQVFDWDSIFNSTDKHIIFGWLALLLIIWSFIFMIPVLNSR